MTTAKKKPRANAKKTNNSSGKKRENVGFMRSFLFFMLWILIIVVIVYGAALLLTRTAGFRSILAEKMAEQTGVPLHIGASSVDWKLNLTLENILSENPANVGNPLVEVVWLKLSWGLKNGHVPMLKGLEAKGCRIRLVQDEKGGWSPGFLAPLADKVTRLGQLGAVNMMMKGGPGNQGKAGASVPETKPPRLENDSEPSMDLFKNMTVTIADSSISWWRNGSEAAVISGLNFMSRAVMFPGRDLQYYKVDAAHAQLGQSKKMNNISFEMLATKGRNIVLGPRANWQSHKKDAAPAKAPVSRGMDDEMTDVERDILAEAEAVLNRGVSVPDSVSDPVDVVVDEKPVEEVVIEEFDIAAFDDLTDDESEALVEYIQEMLEMDPETMGSDYE